MLMLPNWIHGSFGGIMGFVSLSASVTPEIPPPLAPAIQAAIAAVIGLLSTVFTWWLNKQFGVKK